MRSRFSGLRYKPTPQARSPEKRGFILYVQYKFAKLSKLYFKLLDNKVSEKVYFLIDMEFYSLLLKYGFGEFFKSEIPSNIIIDKKLQPKENEDIILRRKKVCEEVNNLILYGILAWIFICIIIGFLTNWGMPK
jgi:hypothetical protein